ncbi:unnamed protein product [Spirodela intermedia]|uniref:Uncharacterized protein n=1 Tax=Spirodela intermedia TaxID=51605 RepID=A0A7I8LLU7_SPIIN|nr:unnamed protein product [Spirodela intermedia]
MGRTRGISWRNHKGRSAWSSSRPPPGDDAATRFKIAEAMSPPGKDILRAIPPWREQLTARGLAASLAVGATYSLVAMKLSLTTGLVPPLNVSSSFLAFIILRAWTGLLRRAGLSPRPFTPQENAVVQTCATACYSIAMGGGFGSYLLALSKNTYEQAGSSGGYRDPAIGWMTSFLFSVSFVGLLPLVPLRKIMIVDYKLAYPSGTATAVLINGFHTPQGDKMARKQVQSFARAFGLSFSWSLIKWVFSGEVCAAGRRPSVGPTAFSNFSLAYVGAGMICSHLVNLSLLMGAALSWGLLWPLVRRFSGAWYAAGLPESSMKGLQGYKVFGSIALILGDGLYNFVKVVVIVAGRACRKSRRTGEHPGAADGGAAALEDLQRDEVFLKESIPSWAAAAGYALMVVLSVAAVPLIFPEVRRSHLLLAQLAAPPLSFCNAYGAGLTDISMGYNYGKAALFLLAACAGEPSGVIAGLVGCGLVKSAVSAAAELMQDLKTGHLTLASPRAMLLAQMAGTAMGCVLAPLAFFVFYGGGFAVGDPAGAFKAPYALIYRNMAVLAVEGLSTLPGNCLWLCGGLMCFALVLNATRDLLGPESRRRRWLPLPAVMSVPFLVGPEFAVNMCVGSLLVLAWGWFGVAGGAGPAAQSAAAAGLVCGDGLWALPSSLLALAKIPSPLCVKFPAE